MKDIIEAAEKNQPQGAEEKQVSERIRNIVSAIREKTAMSAYRLEIIEDSEPDIFDSKFGGVPYWDVRKDYPLDAQGRRMMLLAQINFTEAALKDERLPQRGMLQFFIASEDDVFGMDFEQPDSQKNFRVIFHEQIDLTVTKEQVMALDIPVSTDTDTAYSPVFVEAAVKIIETTAYMGPEDVMFDKTFRETVKEQTGEDIGSQSCYKYLDDEEYDYLYEILRSDGHRILGYPYFTQYDPRESVDVYDTLLLQIDSDMRESRDYVLWGDCGVGNFFINGEALKKKDFSKVLYNWDCC